VSFQLRSRDGSEYLIQHDSEAIINTWHKAITLGIEELVGRAWASRAGGEGAARHCIGQLCPHGPDSMAPVPWVRDLPCRYSPPLWLEWQGRKALPYTYHASPKEALQEYSTQGLELPLGSNLEDVPISREAEGEEIL
jgi:hypothetical protein